MGLKVLPGPSMQQRTTLRLGGTATAEIVVGHVNDLDELPGALEKLGVPPLMLGKGSNLLARDGELPLALVRVPEPAKPEIVGFSGDRVTVRADAGMGLPAFLSWVASKGLAGMEGLSGIPGTIGGAVAMNAGSYGTDMSRVMRRVLLFSPCCGLRWADREDVLTGYRHFAPRTVDEWFLVMGVEVDLKEDSREAIKSRMAETMNTKRASQPLEAWSAGCVFKNPQANSAGRLLDEAGFRGRQLGGMAFSERHANFLVNTGGGTSADALALIAEAQSAVSRTHGIDLELEVKVIP
ncbi:UDP-N-acetylmuramate dehydrogenase [Desulfobaculum sp. SPO524]|uniref:UDP-N-acetylmuramate dehydrogenase n=1 Tax=Desulfobaculum sp. SPO524 TaxID=3378071 RepID=UPI003852F68E